ncbi:MAG: hypothetical protein ACO1PI_07110 [Bacteroidota bacterium]
MSFEYKLLLFLDKVEIRQAHPFPLNPLPDLQMVLSPMFASTSVGDSPMRTSG